LHLVGILFPHINEDARSKSHQISLAVSQVGEKFYSVDGTSHFEKEC